MGSTDLPEPFPSEQVVEAFYREVEHEEGLVAVHCSHGLNRTGYLIIRYLVDRKGVEPEEAIRRFNKARGFPLQRASILNYITSRGWLGKEGREGEGHSKQEGRSLKRHEGTTGTPVQQKNLGGVYETNRCTRTRIAAADRL